MTNTQAGIGTRKQFATLGDRNFEDSGTVQYAALREPFVFLGVSYHSGTALPFDVGGTSYSVAAVEELRIAWDQEWITPLS